MKNYQYLPPECPHSNVVKEHDQLGKDTGDYVCLDCGATDVDLIWFAKYRKQYGNGAGTSKP